MTSSENKSEQRAAALARLRARVRDLVTGPAQEKSFDLKHAFGADPEPALAQLTDDDLELWERLKNNTLTAGEFLQYRSQVAEELRTAVIRSLFGDAVTFDTLSLDQIKQLSDYRLKHPDARSGFLAYIGNQMMQRPAE